MSATQDEQLAPLFFDVLSSFMLTLKKSAASESEWRMNSHAFFVLYTLSHTEQAPMTMTHLAEELQISKQQLTKLVNDLEAKTYVERVHDRANRRLVYIHITQEGKGRLSAFSEQLLRPVRETLKLYSGAEREQLAEHFQGLMEFLRRVRELGE